MKIIYIIFMSLCVGILSSVLLVKQNTSIIFGDASDLYTVNISVDKSQSPEKIESILQEIKNIDKKQIRKVTLISSQELIADVEKVLPNYSSGLFEKEELEQILNPAVEVQLSAEANSASIIEKMKMITGINQVVFSGDWVEKFKSIFTAANQILDTVFILFFIILSFLITVLIRNLLISTKESISLHALMGATPQQSFFKPFSQIMIATFISYIIGMAMTFLIGAVIRQKISENTDLGFIHDRMSFLNQTSLSLIAVGLIFNLVISYGLSFMYIRKEFYKND